MRFLITHLGSLLCPGAVLIDSTVGLPGLVPIGWLVASPSPLWVKFLLIGYL